MKTVGCLRCGVWYDPAKPHLCGLLADETARGLAERLDTLERRFQGLDVEERRRLSALERRVEDLEAAQAHGERVRADEDAPGRAHIVLPFMPSPADESRTTPEPKPAQDKRAAHAEYMKRWRLKQALRRGDFHA
jgi:hypothetical protein